MVGVVLCTHGYTCTSWIIDIKVNVPGSNQKLPANQNEVADGTIANKAWGAAAAAFHEIR